MGETFAVVKSCLEMLTGLGVCGALPQRPAVIGGDDTSAGDMPDAAWAIGCLVSS
jgi:hypothetical protein